VVLTVGTDIGPPVAVCVEPGPIELDVMVVAVETDPKVSLVLLT